MKPHFSSVLKTPLQNVHHILAILSGKGGVGKSTVTTNLALALKSQGKKVAILDADIYGPSIHKMLGSHSSMIEEEQRIFPAVGLDIPFVSISFFQGYERGAVVRAPIANQVITQFLDRVEWGNLDYLLIDFPPGTGDIQITLLQRSLITAAITVTTPQEVALLDVRKSIYMLDILEVPLLGIVENMSYFFVEEGERHYPFGKKGGEKLAQEFQVPLIAEIPIDSAITKCGDEARSLFDVNSYSLRSFTSLAKKVEREISLLLEQESLCLGEFELEWDLEDRREK